MNPLQIKRLLPMLLAAVSVFASTALLDVALDFSFGVHPAWLTASIDTNILNAFCKRLARVEQLKASGAVTDANLVAVSGLSPVRDGLDPAVLNAADPRHRRWLVLGAQGRTFATLQAYLRTLTGSALRPRTLVLGISESMLHEDDHAIPQDAAPSLLFHHLRRRQIYHAALDVSWLYRNRDALADGTTIAIYEFARDLRALLRLPMSVTYQPEMDPWTSWTSETTSRDDPAMVQAQWEGHHLIMNPAQFQHVDRQVAALRQIVADSRARGARVICILMPETSRLRATYLPVVYQRFADALAVASDDIPLKVINLRDAMPDDLFFNDAHLNPAGAQSFSNLLPTLIP